MKHGKIPGTFEQDEKSSHQIDEEEEEEVKAQTFQDLPVMERNANTIGIKGYGGCTFE